MHADVLHQLYDQASDLQVQVADLVYDLELAGLAETEVDLYVTEARKALGKAMSALQRRHKFA